MNNMKNYLQMSHVLGLNLKETITKKRMEFVRKHLTLSAFVFALFWNSSAGAASLSPTNYTATPGDGIAQGGYYNYFDDTGSQLTDGIYGVNDFSANLGNGPAYEWVGWRGVNPVITFQFSSPVTINQVGIDLNRNESDLIFLPSTVTIDGTDFAVDTNAIPDDTRGTLYFNGSWTGTDLTLDLMDCSTNNWIFVDEVTFSGVSVPEPSVFGILVGSFGLLLLRVRRSYEIAICN